MLDIESVVPGGPTQTMVVIYHPKTMEILAVGREYWEAKLVRISTRLNEAIVCKLKVRYNAIKIEEEAFLDIGRVLVKEETILTIRVLNILHSSDIAQYLESIHEKCFMEFHYDMQLDDEFECRR